MKINMERLFGSIEKESPTALVVFTMVDVALYDCFLLSSL